MAKRIRHSIYKPELNMVKEEHYVDFADIVPNSNPWYLFVKRASDIVCSSAALILLSPLFLCVAAAIKLSDGGPVFFKQRRVGKNMKEFEMYKFRSMVPDAEKILQELRAENEASGPVFKMKNDPRVTKVGRFIRRYSIDELPQLINIFKGDMSIVGPRPPLPCEVALYSDYDKQRLKIRPGLTCYWQCFGRSTISFEKWVDMDLEYINDQGIWCDFKMILRTIPAVLKGNGAY